MYTIASLLDPVSNQHINQLWQFLEDKCDLKGIKQIQLPHISWQASENFNINEIDLYLEAFAKRHKPFNIKST